jgi:hypothetical protein
MKHIINWSYQMTDDWQYTNQFFEEGKIHYSKGGEIKDCPYDYLKVEQDNEKKVQWEHYRQMEWLAGFRFQFEYQLQNLKNIA